MTVTPFEVLVGLVILGAHRGRSGREAMGRLEPGAPGDRARDVDRHEQARAIIAASFGVKGSRQSVGSGIGFLFRSVPYRPLPL